jgi:hypothetical protein
MDFSYREFLRFMFFVLASFMFYTSSIAQLKIDESFSGNNFPPEGWSIFDIQGTGSQWLKSEKYSRSGEGCAVSEFDTTYGNSYLVTKRIVPSQDDSLIFFLRQTFYRVYNDTLKILATTSDSLPTSMNILLLTVRDGLNYPPHQMYSRYAISLNQFAGDTVWLAFKHINVNGDILRIDDVRVGNVLQNDISMSEILSPRDVVGLCSVDSIVPSAVIRNNGVNAQTNEFTVSCRIDGPVSFVRTVNTVIAAGETKELSFETIAADQPGEYEVKIYSGLVNDQNRLNDTLTGSFAIRQYSSGMGDGGYYYASSEICSQPQGISPEFCWKDTTGSFSLLMDGHDVSHGLLRGDVDNGYFAISDFLPPGMDIRFFDRSHDSLYISVNGIISFKECPQLYMSEPTDSAFLPTESAAFIAPLWMDYDNSPGDNGSRISYKIAGNTLIVTFEGMHVKGGDSLTHASFQTAISLTHADNQNAEILFQYNASNTGTTLKNQFLSGMESNCFTGIVSNEQNLKYRKKVNGRYTDAGQLFESDMALEIGPSPENLNSKCSMLSASLLLEGYVQRSDTVIIGIHNYQSPSEMIESVKAILTPEGNTSAIFTLADVSTGYFISVKHRNSIETWSKDTILHFSNSELFYDFTRDTMQAYGNNMKLINGKAHIYSGDVNQDRQIEITDASLVSNDAFEYLLGFSRTDLNGDGIVDSSDMIMVDGNVFRYVTARIPISAGLNSASK